MSTFSQERIFTVVTRQPLVVDFNKWNELFDFLSRFIETFYLERDVELSPVWNYEMELGEIIASALALPVRDGENRIISVRESFGEDSFLHTPYLHPYLDSMLPSYF